MQLSEVLDQAEVVPVKEAARLMGKTENTVRMQLRAGRLVGRHWGGVWMVPILRDDDSGAVFLYHA